MIRNFFIAAAFFMLVFSQVLRHARAEAPPHPPTTGPIVSLTLDSGQFPKHPGYYVIRGEGSIGDRSFRFGSGIFLPAIFGKTSAPLPIVMTLHNRGNSGSTGSEDIAREGLGMLLRTNWPDSRMTGEQPDHPLHLRKDAKFIGLIPQCPDGFEWNTPGMPAFLCKLIDAVSQHYHADNDRVYLTGFSYGASNTWLVAMAEPQRFAAIAVMDGRATPDPATDVAKLKDVAVYLSVGDTDGPFDAAADQMHVALSDFPHRNFVWNIVKDGNHFCYYSVYRNPYFWQWMLAQRRHQN
jgi:predicted peptidase